MIGDSDENDEDEPLLPTVENVVFQTSNYLPLIPNIVSIFVVAFNTRSGNQIEWNYPENYPLAGVEFKALPSGSHNVQHDIMFFELQSHYGIAAYIMKQVDNPTERGARMKSVGIISTSYLTLPAHQDKLLEFAKESVEHPGSYNYLIRYFIEFNASCGFSLEYELRSSTVGSMYDLFHLQGPNIFVLWKMVLIKKRILLECTPPIARQCSYIECLVAMTHTQPSGASCPLFYVTVNDINQLQYKPAYLACTADVILKSKGTQVYDIYVTGNSVQNDKGSDICCTRGDKKRYNQLAAVVDREYGHRNAPDIDRMIISYFTQLTDQLFNTLADLVTGDKMFTSHNLEDIRLDTSDLPYLQILVDKLGYDVELFQPGCCDKNLGYII